MDYNDELAKKIAAEHAIDPATIRVWKNRGKIPDRYLKAGFTRTLPLSPVDLERQRKILRIVGMPDLRKSEFARLIGGSKMHDVTMGDSQFTIAQIEDLEGRISAMKAEISGFLRDDRRFLDRYQKRLIAILARPEIVVRVVLCDTGGLSESVYQKFAYAIQKQDAVIQDIGIIDDGKEALRKLYVKLQ